MAFYAPRIERSLLSILALDSECGCVKRALKTGDAHRERIN